MSKMDSKRKVIAIKVFLNSLRIKAKKWKWILFPMIIELVNFSKISNTQVRKLEYYTVYLEQIEAEQLMIRCVLKVTRL
jgi:hypothetical protein